MFTSINKYSKLGLACILRSGRSSNLKHSKTYTAIPPPLESARFFIRRLQPGIINNDSLLIFAQVSDSAIAANLWFRQSKQDVILLRFLQRLRVVMWSNENLEIQLLSNIIRLKSSSKSYTLPELLRVVFKYLSGSMFLLCHLNVLKS